MSENGGEGAFRARTVALMIALGLIGFVGMLVMGAYAPDLRSGRNGGAHALSNGVTGYAGLVRLAQATGRNPTVVRDKSGDGDRRVRLKSQGGGMEAGGRPGLTAVRAAES